MSDEKPSKVIVYRTNGHSVSFDDAVYRVNNDNGNLIVKYLKNDDTLFAQFVNGHWQYVDGKTF